MVKMQDSCYALVVPKTQTKSVKTELDARHLLAKHTGILKCVIVGMQDHMVLPLSLETRNGHHKVHDTVLGKAKDVLQSSQLVSDAPFLGSYDVTMIHVAQLRDGSEHVGGLQRAFIRSLDALPEDVCGFINANRKELIAAISSAYVIYQPMLLLPVGSLNSDRWVELLGLMDRNPENSIDFFQTLATNMDVTHVAVNAAVPGKLKDETTTELHENSIRSPTAIKPLHGDFGPALSAFPRYVPTNQDFEKAFWVSTRQNGITQTWAPRYTMFSGGNVTEKARLLTLPSVGQAVRIGQEDGQGCAAVDLFSGIGYFAFSYAKAGLTKILCWDLNPWSIEGLRRGSVANRWTYQSVVNVEAGDTVVDEDLIAAAINDNTCLSFCETNERAASRIESMRAHLPPIRHVNCGMLPTTGQAWKTALKVIDPLLGGWIHLHESMTQKDASSRTDEYLVMLQEYADHKIGHNEKAEPIKLEGTFRVKSMGPRLWHHVMDFWIPPRRVQKGSVRDR